MTYQHMQVLRHARSRSVNARAELSGAPYFKHSGLFASLLLALSPALAAAAQPDADAGNVMRQGDVMVPMRDGTQLATDLYLPAQDGKPRSGRFPALLMRTP
jgi:predicted acyl esterase